MYGSELLQQGLERLVGDMNKLREVVDNDTLLVDK
jgi:hypothetical protein